nr:penicillin-binding protein 2 [Anaerolineae bacterium]
MSGKVSLQPASENLSRQRTLRLLIFQIMVVLIFIGLAARIYVIQFIQRDIYEARANENRFDDISIPATRGIILDRNGVALAVNVASANVTVTPALLPEDDFEEMAVLERLAGLLGIPLSGELTTVDERGIPQRSLLTMVREQQGIEPFSPVIIKSDVDHDIARLLISEQINYPGVAVDWVSVREYPTGSLTAHIIGYMGPIPPERAEEFEEEGYVLDRDRIGYDGIEFSLENYLAGTPGLQRVERDVAGRIVRTLGESRPAQDGYSVRLTLDSDLQQAAQEALVDMINQLKVTNPDNLIGYDRGVVIATNPRTGEILAMVSWPTYDNSRFARNIDYTYYEQVLRDPLRPLFNQAVNSQYPPGSIFKVITATGVLEEGVVTPEYEITDPGLILLEDRYYPNDPGRAQPFVCWLEQGHGSVNFIEGIAWSCDVYFYKVGGGYQDEVPVGLGITRLGAWMSFFGLGQQTGIELAGEAAGFIPSPDWKRIVWGESWSTGDTYNSAFGQGYVLATPLHMINALNTIINDGIQAKPTLIREILDTEGRVIAGFEPVLHDIREEIRAYWLEQYGEFYPETLSDTLSYVRAGMRAAVTIEGGTARTAQNDYLPYVPIAGKTGTAEFCDNIAASLDQCFYGNWPAHAWFMAYAPYENPEISVIAFVYNGGEGSAIALPVAAEVMDAYFRIKTERALQASPSD